MSDQNNNWRNSERKREQEYSNSYYPRRRFNQPTHNRGTRFNNSSYKSYQEKRTTNGRGRERERERGRERGWERGWERGRGRRRERGMGRGRGRGRGREREREIFQSIGRRRGLFKENYDNKPSTNYPRSRQFKSGRRLNIDREKTVPFLLRIYLSLEKHNPKSYYEKVESHKDAQVHTWLDCTLGDLTEYLKTVSKHAKKENVKLDFNLVYKDRRTGDVRFKEAGYTYSSSNESLYHDKTLSELNFSIGDWIDVAFIDHN
ncbi:sap18 [Anaeramoeba flamelloides]|uniref:Sap18 n=1 Tax=Anaeramoeba flamelloides TaxID=1746091 RepID=A0ABQ8XHB7_9EUKA|nr:sap18 [Anaeramoeba flamelloides]